MKNPNKLPGMWRLHMVSTETAVNYADTEHETAEIFVFRPDGTFDKHLKTKGKVETAIKNEKWVKGPRQIFMLNNNKPFLEIDMVTHDTLVLKTNGTDEKRVYKKIK